MEKNENPGGRFGALPIQPIYLKIGRNWPNWQCCLARSSIMAPRSLIFSIAMVAYYSFYVKPIATRAPTFLRSNNSVLAIVMHPNILKIGDDTNSFSMTSPIT